MKKTIIGALVGAVAGVIFAAFFNYLVDYIREWRSVEKETSTINDITETKVTVDTKGFLTFSGRPIFIVNSGKINSISIPENLRNKFEIKLLDESTAIAITKDATLNSVKFNVFGSGTTDVMTSPPVK